MSPPTSSAFAPPDPGTAASFTPSRRWSGGVGTGPAFTSSKASTGTPPVRGAATGTSAGPPPGITGGARGLAQGIHACKGAEATPSTRAPGAGAGTWCSFRAPCPAVDIFCPASRRKGDGAHSRGRKECGGTPRLAEGAQACPCAPPQPQRFACTTEKEGPNALASARLRFRAPTAPRLKGGATSRGTAPGPPTVGRPYGVIAARKGPRQEAARPGPRGVGTPSCSAGTREGLGRCTAPLGGTVGVAPRATCPGGTLRGRRIAPASTDRGSREGLGPGLILS